MQPRRKKECTSSTLTSFRRFGGREESVQDIHACKDAAREAAKECVVFTKSKPPVREGLMSCKGSFPQCLFICLF